jgi:hypothetical protein
LHVLAHHSDLSVDLSYLSLERLHLRRQIERMARNMPTNASKEWSFMVNAQAISVPGERLSVARAAEAPGSSTGSSVRQVTVEMEKCLQIISRRNLKSESAGASILSRT